MTDHALIFLFLPLAACWVSVVYFIAAPKSASSKELVLGSVHGVFVAALAAVAWVRSLDDPTHPVDSLIPLSLLAPPVLIALALKFFRGKSTVHAYQVINLLCYLELLTFCNDSWAALRIRM